MVVFQFPNTPLIVMLLAWLVGAVSSGWLAAAGRAVFVIAGVIWSYGELTQGANWLRRTLGAAVMLWLFISLVRLGA
ncbi:hypothetical protein KY386_02145 [Candidatus Parcubacteria bacterium]|nr:hypothetical protein [Candidatus Parcubacteria bacterium]